MNEKIKELLPNPFAVDYTTYDEPMDLYREQELEKFAELIILECINQVELTWMNQNGWSRNAACVQSIKDYFKVE